MPQHSTDPVVLQAREGFMALYGSRLRELVLFGSRARGDAREDSDYDLLVVVDDLTTEDGRNADAFCGDLLTQADALVTPFLLDTKRARELRERERRIMREIDQEGLSLLDSTWTVSTFTACETSRREGSEA